VPAATARLLARLARHRPVAIITGRAIVDVAPRLGFEPRFIVGNHGAEDPGEPGAPQWEAALEGLRARAAALAQPLSAAGVQVEDKRFSMALHYRLAADPALAQQCIHDLLEPVRQGLATVGGKCVVNVMADGSPDKGDALLALVRRAGAGAALFVGDDLNDEAAFIKAPPHWMTVRVGRSPVATRARFYLPSRLQVGALLQEILDAAP
jgi:trehalose 6-phosphate phosphatase